MKSPLLYQRSACMVERGALCHLLLNPRIHTMILSSPTSVALVRSDGHAGKYRTTHGCPEVGDRVQTTQSMAGLPWTEFLSAYAKRGISGLGQGWSLFYQCPFLRVDCDNQRPFHSPESVEAGVPLNEVTTNTLDYVLLPAKMQQVCGYPDCAALSVLQKRAVRSVLLWCESMSTRCSSSASRQISVKRMAWKEYEPSWRER